MATQTRAAEEESQTASAAVSDVRLERVRKVFGDVVAVDDIDLDVAPGEFFTMLGPSGSGKTTTLRLIAGFEHPDAGRVLLGGDDVTRLPPYARDVNTVFQDYALFPHMSVADNVGYGLRVRKVRRAERRARVEEALETVRLQGLGKRRPAQLSGGQRQRVALARAIVNRPQVLLLDEPLGALDLKLREEMQIELKRIHRDLGMTFVYVTHDQDEALTMSDRIAVFNRGRIEQTAAPGRALRASGHGVRRRLRRRLERARAGRPALHGPAREDPDAARAASPPRKGRSRRWAGSAMSSISGWSPATSSSSTGAAS